MLKRLHNLTIAFGVALALGWLPFGISGAGRTQAECGRGAPLDSSDIEALLEAGVPEAPILDAVRSCGVTFIPDAGQVARLRGLGADDALVRLLSPPGDPASGAVWTTLTDRREMLWIPAGAFSLGSPADEAGRDPDETQHAVTIEAGFWLDSTEVSNEAYRRFVLANPNFRKDQIDDNAHLGDYLDDWLGDDYPAGTGGDAVAYVSWHAANAYAEWAGKRLPTEAEWEYAARAGSEGRFWWGDAFDARRSRPSRAATGPVPQRRSAWGVYDMVGGVWEWTASLYRDYPFDANDGRNDPEAPGSRVVRGGFWGSGEPFLRSANRSSEEPRLASGILGFRTAR